MLDPLLALALTMVLAHTHRSCPAPVMPSCMVVTALSRAARSTSPCAPRQRRPPPPLHPITLILSPSLCLMLTPIHHPDSMPGGRSPSAADRGHHCHIAVAWRRRPPSPPPSTQPSPERGRRAQAPLAAQTRVLKGPRGRWCAQRRAQWRAQLERSRQCGRAAHPSRTRGREVACPASGF